MAMILKREVSNRSICISCSVTTPKSKYFYQLSMTLDEEVLLQKIWLFYKTSKKHHKWDIYMP